MKLCFIILSILSSFFATLDRQTLQSDFIVTVSAEATQPLSYTGTVTMHGEQFLLTMAQIEAAYDGKTLYMFMPKSNEMQLTEPTPEELLQANPLAFAKTFADQCEVLERDKGNGQYLIVLVPHDKTKTHNIGRVELLLRQISNLQSPIPAYLPLSVEMREGKQTTRLQLKNPQYITTAPVFRLDKPDAFINDLR